MQHIRYKPRINLGIINNGRKTIDYASRYAKIAPTLVQPLQPPPVISVPISPPSSFYETPSIVAPGYFDQPATAFPSADEAMPLDTEIPEQFRYSKEQLLDMLARGASETYERTGETDSGLPLELELEQISRELDATKQYVVDADGTIIPIEPKAGTGVVWLAAAAAAFFILGG